MKRKGKMQIIKISSILTLPLFIISILTLPQPAQASSVASVVPNQAINSLTYQLENQRIPATAMELNTGSGETSVKAILDSEDSDRIYLLSETRRGEVTVLKYIYDDILEEVSILWFAGRAGDETQFSYYSRYTLGPNNSLDTLLEEGWVKGDSLTPFKLYEISYGKTLIRVFDRSGKLLRLESEKGTIREFLYTQNAQLLAIRSVSGSGDSSFVDLIAALFHDIQTPFPSHAEMLAVLPNSEKRFQLLDLERSVISPKVAPGFREILNLNENYWYLEWMESAHPMRAGPRGGVLK